MRIRIGKKGLRLCLWLPLSLLKSKLVLRLIRQSVARPSPDGKTKDKFITESTVSGLPDTVADDREEENCPLEDDVRLPTRQQLIALYQALRSVVKACGHFDLVRVRACDGTVVRVTI